MFQDSTVLISPAFIVAEGEIDFTKSSPVP
jgi:hypothetical protein